MTFAQPRDERTAWFLWGLLFLVLTVGILIGRKASVAVHYAAGAEHWLNSENLYRDDGNGFLYLPQAAILFVPFALLPDALSEIAWRMLTIGVFAVGLFRCCQTAQRTSGVRLFPLVTCLTIPLAWSAARNGQATLIIAGLMMLAVADLARENWWRASVLLCLGLAFKPLTLVLILLVLGTYRPMTGRLLVGMSVVAAIPYLWGDGAYATSQYVAFVEALRVAAHEGTHRPWAHAFGLLQTAGIDVPEWLQLAVRIGAGLATLAAVRLAYRRLPPTRVALFLYAFAACYVMLFNPRTENNTYSMLGPALGVFCAEALLVHRRPRAGAGLLILTLGTVGSFEIGRRLVPGVNPVWLAPLMCLGFTGHLIVSLSREIRRPPLPFIDFEGMLADPRPIEASGPSAGRAFPAEELSRPRFPPTPIETSAP